MRRTQRGRKRGEEEEAERAADGGVGRGCQASVSGILSTMSKRHCIEMDGFKCTLSCVFITQHL